jgi:hypothetical protein
MKKIIPILKSILILCLAALTVFQVHQLWLVNLTNRNFFIYLQARFAANAPDGQSAFARPYRIVYGAGDGVFQMLYSGIADSEEWVFGETVLQAVLQHGSVISQPADIFSRPVVIYEYAFPMCADIFTKALGQRRNTLKNNGIESFRSIVIQTSGLDEQNLNIFFIGEQNVLGFSLSDIRETLEITPVPPNKFHYTRTNAGFVPNAPDGGFSYNAVNVENPFRNPQGLLTRSHIRSMVEAFFDNPATIIPGTSVDGIYTFSTRNAMVRYLENSVLEYTSYRTIGRTASENFMADFSAALDFVGKDPNVINEIYLRNHETRGRAYVFRFNYVIGNHPLVFTEEWFTRSRCNDPLTAPIEVIVDRGRVVRYRRIVYTFSAGGLAWKDLPDTNASFPLGFPISPNDSDDVIELALIRQV